MLVLIVATGIGLLIDPNSTHGPGETVMYVCGYSRCLNSDAYGKMIQPVIIVWNAPDPDRGGIHHRASHGEMVVIMEERQVNPDPSGLWYHLRSGGWANDMVLTEERCTPQNLHKFAISKC